MLVMSKSAAVVIVVVAVEKVSGRRKRWGKSSSGR